MVLPLFCSNGALHLWHCCGLQRHRKFGLGRLRRGATLHKPAATDRRGLARH